MATGYPSNAALVDEVGMGVGYHKRMLAKTSMISSDVCTKQSQSILDGSVDFRLSSGSDRFVKQCDRGRFLEN